MSYLFKDYDSCMEDLELVKAYVHFWDDEGCAIEPEDVRNNLDNVYAIQLDSNDAVGFLMTYASNSDFLHQLHGAFPEVCHKYVWVEDLHWIDSTAILPRLKIFGEVA